ncbi:MAG: hypothetical protein JXA37_13395 [Chloroflexia bacterium]|nr:hypothetical protein [Chloroflexia bacterium]
MSEQSAKGQLQRAVMAVQSGRLEDARRLLAVLLRQDPGNAQAWLWMGKALDDAEKRAECFTRVLMLDPNNDEARLGLVALRSGPQLRSPDGAGESPAEPTEWPTRIVAHPSSCTQCGSHLRYDIASGTLRCPHCGTRHRFRQDVEATWYAIPPELSTPEAQSEPMGQKSLRCRSCAATTPLSARTASLACPFCGSPQVVQVETARPLLPPQAIVPFQVDRDQAEQALRKWLAQGMWNPGNLAGRADIVEFHGAYLPFWAFKGLAEISYRADYSSPVLQGPRSQRNFVPVEDVLLPASYALEDRLLRPIEPFELERAVPFSPAYLAGWPAEVYQIALADATIQAREIMAREASIKAQSWAPPTEYRDSLYDVALVSGGWRIGWGRRQPGQMQTHRQATYRAHFWTVRLDSFQQVLLPVWLCTYRYRGQLYTVAVNGQTGQVGGQAPRSAAMLALVGSLGLALVATLTGLLLRFGPRLRDWLAEGERSGSFDQVGDLLLSEWTFYLLVFVVVILFTLWMRRSRIRRWFRSLWRAE